MGILTWIMMGLAIWHFTVFLPDRYWGGIVGALLGAVTGAVVVALVINGFVVPGRHDTHLITAIDAIPGALIGIAAIYAEGVRRGNPPLDL
jgi:hypothetical protein